MPDITTLRADPAFERLYLRAIGAKAGERWLARLEGPAPPTREQAFDGASYVVIAICSRTTATTTARSSCTRRRSSACWA